ncbi:MAG: flagellar biosynthesis protein FlgA [Deltaproteobacteria bacterium CG11_big_fil_rev_8_21_14_0_20_45_16]|nr:MAG: flagellar biosynthesis protein FlgA [Deltaproteobacteria bacterium CG11_big_fil_rev_8_21_14_0_20_45_16]
MKRNSNIGIQIIIGLILFLALTIDSFADVRLKDISTLQGVRQNQLIGYGLVVGLQGTGDGSSNQFTTQSLATMMNNLGVGIDPSQVKVKNVAGVIVTAQLPPFARMGSKMEILVSSLGDAKSLQGGTLLLTPLKGADGKVYAVAQGPVTIGGFAEEQSGAKTAKNHPTVGKVPGGATIERELPFDFSNVSNLSYSLNSPDFTTANRVVRAINRLLDGKFAVAKDSGTINIDIPPKYRSDVVKLVSTVEAVKLRPDISAKVVVNERTGTVVVGEDVKISTVAVAHGSLSITIQPETVISQPEAFSDGETVVREQAQISVTEGEDKFALIPGGVSIGDLVKALNAIGITPRDLIAVFQAIQAAGALQAELEII